MKKYLPLLLTLALLCSLAACGSNAENNDDLTPPAVSDSADVSDTEPEETPDTPTESADADQSEEISDTPESGNGILIAYFTYGENAPLAEGVDASSSASIQLRDDGSITGNTGLVADMIAGATGGELFSILTAEQYPDSYNATVDAGQAEKNAGTLPELASHIENLDSYDTIFLGFPNWWYGMPMAVYSFLDEYDLSGKTIIPFVTSGGSGFSNAISEIERLEPDAVVLEGLSISGSRAASAQEDVLDWLDGLGLIQ